MHFWNSLAFSMIERMLAIWSLVPLPFLKTAWTSGSSRFTVHILLKPGLENFEHYFTSMWDECNCAIVWAFFGIALLWDWNENWPFSVLWPLPSFPNLLAYWVQHFNIIIFFRFEIAQLEFHHLLDWRMVLMHKYSKNWKWFLVIKYLCIDANDSISVTEVTVIRQKVEEHGESLEVTHLNVLRIVFQELPHCPAYCLAQRTKKNTLYFVGSQMKKFISLFRRGVYRIITLVIFVIPQTWVPNHTENVY